MQRHYYVIHSLLINSMRLTNDDKSSIKLLRQEKAWGAKPICLLDCLPVSGYGMKWLLDTWTQAHTLLLYSAIVT